MNRPDTLVGDAVWTALDFESAGAASGRSDDPIQVGMAVWRGSGWSDFFRSYLHSAAGITPAARSVHGIRDADVHDAPSMAVLWPEFKARLGGAVVVAHGAGTEKRFLRAFPLHGFGPWLDTLALSRAVLPDLPGHSLGEVTAALDGEEEVRALCPALDWHDALFDAVACLVVLRRIITLGGLGTATVGELLAPDASAYHRRRALLRTARSAGWSG